MKYTLEFCKTGYMIINAEDEEQAWGLAHKQLNEGMGMHGEGDWYEGDLLDEEDESQVGHRHNSGYCGKCWNGVCQYDDDGNFVGNIKH